MRKISSIMVCSKCGKIIAKTFDAMFDTIDCGWECPHCKQYWLSSNGWTKVGNLVIPFEGAQSNKQNKPDPK